MTDKTLSKRDGNVLTILFNAEAQPYREQGETINLPEPSSQAQQSGERAEEEAAGELRAIQLAEEGLLDEAERLLTETIEKYPKGRLTLWNNRAQIRRLAGNVDGALSDLTRVVNTQPTANRSNLPPYDITRALSDAYVHRATIYLLLARSLQSDPAHASIPKSVNVQNSETLEEWASRDFALAAKYGNRVGRVMAALTNPFAKMCGTIVRTALEAEMRLQEGL
jgi:tetratricopeptide (TPR) repeat protein